MSFWPFGRDPANIELVSRVVTAATQSGYRVRGKLTIHFREPQRQADADQAAERCAALAVALLRAAPDHGRVIGAEAQLSADLTARCQGDAAAARGVELAALHVVGDPALSDELRRASGSGTIPAVSASPSVRPPPSAPPPAAPPPTHPPPKPPALLAAPHLGAPPAQPVRRRVSSQMRSIQALLLPSGTPPLAMGQFVAPTVKDSAARLLIGFLRAHDLIAVRRVVIDESSAELLATLVPASDSPPGGYEASRAGEIARWQATLGDGPMSSLQHQVRMLSAYLTREAFAQLEVMPALAFAVIEALCASAFPSEVGLLAEIARLPSPMPADFVSRIADQLTRIARTGDDPVAVAAALAPLVGTIRDDLSVSAMIIKASSGG